MSKIYFIDIKYKSILLEVVEEVKKNLKAITMYPDHNS